MNRGVQVFARGHNYFDEFDRIFKKGAYAQKENKVENESQRLRTGGKDTINTRGSA